MRPPSLAGPIGPQQSKANEQLSRLKQAKELAAANMTPEAAAARMTPEEAKRLSMVRNIGIAVRGPSARSRQDETRRETEQLDRHTSTAARPP
jgi:thiamine monophosphate synthase